MRTLLVSSLLAFSTALGVAGSLQVDPPASANLFIQRDASFPLSGLAAPQTKVAVSILGSTVEATADTTGRWKLSLPPIKEAGGPYTLKISSGSENLTLDQVLVGDTWFCSGQSNMQFPLRVIAPQVIPQGTNPNLRLLLVERRASSKPLHANQAVWTACTPTHLPEFSATAYFFGSELQKLTGVPIGLIVSAWGGKKAQSFTRREALLAEPELKPIVEEWDKLMAAYPSALEKFKQDADAILKKRNEGRVARGLKPYTKAVPPMGPDDANGPENLWNGQILPYVGTPLTGFIWYQGESNSSQAWQYRTLLPTMIQDWRKQWGQGDLPFYIVQLAGYLPRGGEQFIAENKGGEAPPVNSPWAELREAQYGATKLPNVGIATAIDIGERNDIHPKNKLDVGRRLALLAANRVYGKKQEDQGPTYDKVSFANGKATITFTHADGLKTTDGAKAKGFALAGADQKFVWADDAVIVGYTIILSSAKVPDPVAVRYAWADFPETNLTNAAQLPAFPFRTDTWPAVTANSPVTIEEE